jgi:hypothetical protein
MPAVLSKGAEGVKNECRVREVPETMGEHCRIEDLALAGGRHDNTIRAW